MRLEKLWRISVAATIIVFMLAAVLVAALALGWNSPRPAGQPDWRAADPFVLTTARRDDFVVHLLDWSANDFDLETEISVHGFNCIGEAGLIYSAENADRYTVFAVGSDGYYTVKSVEGTKADVIIPWQQFPHIRRGTETNLLRVSCCGATCQFFINDEYAASVERPNRQVGQIGLWGSASGNDRINISFSEIQAWRGCE